MGTAGRGWMCPPEPSPERVRVHSNVNLRPGGEGSRCDALCTPFLCAISSCPCSSALGGGNGLGFAVGADWQQMPAAAGELCRLPQAQLTSSFLFSSPRPPCLLPPWPRRGCGARQEEVLRLPGGLRPWRELRWLRGLGWKTGARLSPPVFGGWK